MARLLIIVALAAHLILACFSAFVGLFMVGHSLDQPLVLLEWAPFFISFVFSALTLLFFILRHRAYLAFASIAGMGSYLSHVVISVVLDNEMLMSEYLYGLIYFGLPMILVFLYEKVIGNPDASR